MPALMQIATNLVLLFVVVMAIGTYTGYSELCAWSQVGRSDADLAVHQEVRVVGRYRECRTRCLACPTLEIGTTARRHEQLIDMGEQSEMMDAGGATTLARFAVQALTYFRSAGPSTQPPQHLRLRIPGCLARRRLTIASRATLRWPSTAHMIFTVRPVPSVLSVLLVLSVIFINRINRMSRMTAFPNGQWFGMEIRC